MDSQELDLLRISLPVLPAMWFPPHFAFDRRPGRGFQEFFKAPGPIGIACSNAHFIQYRYAERQVRMVVELSGRALRSRKDGMIGLVVYLSCDRFLSLPAGLG